LRIATSVFLLTYGSVHLFDSKLSKCISSVQEFVKKALPENEKPGLSKSNNYRSAIYYLKNASNLP
jgi:hypothetical protein